MAALLLHLRTWSSFCRPKTDVVPKCWHRRSLTKAAESRLLIINLGLDELKEIKNSGRNHVTREAQNFLARDGREIAVQKSKPWTRSRSSKCTSADPYTSKAAEDAAGRGRSTGGPPAQVGHCITDQDGNEFCFRFAQGKPGVVLSRTTSARLAERLEGYVTDTY